jgi:hypothetical protein
MPNVLRNVLAILAGLVIGSGVNMALIALSPSLVPHHFTMPFLAHALGTFVGALVACLIAASHKARMAYVIGFVFLCGGIAAAFMIPAPAWFIALDLVVAYLPMAWLAARVGAGMQAGSSVVGEGEV